MKFTFGIAKQCAVFRAVLPNGGSGCLGTVFRNPFPRRRRNLRHSLAAANLLQNLKLSFSRLSVRLHSLRRFATTEEVANLVTYVCSPMSAATNGAALRVDGGVVQACF